MEIKPNSNLTFKATLSFKLKQELQRQAVKEGGKTVLALGKKIKEVNSWGHKCSILKLGNSEIEGVEHIELCYNTLKNHSLLIKSDKTLLDSFMNMTHGFFIEKEKQLRNIVNKNFFNK